MELWEFLIQKDGDRSWLPVEAPGAEVLEGRYRVVARSSRVNTSVEIRITHTSLEEDPPKRRIQKRQSQTSPDGLLVVMPYTQLQPGIWELQCAGDLMSDMLGNGWTYTIQLQVLAQESERSEYWDDEPENSAPESSPKVEVAPAVLRLVKTSAAKKSEAVEPTAPEPAVLEPAASESAISAQIEPELADETSTSSTEELPAEELPAEELPAEEAVLPAVPPVAQEPAASQIAPADGEINSEALPQTPVPSLEMAEVLSQQVVDEVFDALELDPETTSATARTQRNAEPITAEATVVAVEESPVWLVLSQESYAARRGEPLTLSGRIETDEGASPANSLRAELYLCLRDPQSAQVLVENRQMLVLRSLPHEFAMTLSLPVVRQTRLLMGELSLLSRTGAEAEVLATYSFSVTSDVSDLLEAIANSTSAEVYPPLETVERTGELDLSFLDFLNAPKPLLTFQPVGTKALPPQLYEPSLKTPQLKTLDLPSFKQHPKVETFENKVEPFENKVNTDVAELLSQPAAITEPPEASVENLQAAVEAPPLAEPPIASPSYQDLPELKPNLPDSNSVPVTEDLAPPRLASIPVPPPPSPTSPELSDAPLEWSSSSFLLDEPAPVPEQPLEVPLAPEDIEFRSLNLKHRFWSRLSSLASDEELTTLLKKDVKPSGGPSTTSAFPAANVTEDSQEVVVEDDDPQPTRWNVGSDRLTRQFFSSAPTNLPEDEPIPTPRLEVPKQEMVSGDRISVGVKLPRSASPLYVKLWIYDPQNRVVADGPRWLMDLSPNGLGELEAWTQVEVPYGCLEMQVEAIAIEIATQRESHKVSIARAVVPANLPAHSLDELDI